jgi:hypothetical protein
MVVIECHGKQHYEPVAFDGDVEASVTKFRDQKYRDQAKQEAAMDAGFAYVVVPYSLQNSLSEGILLGMIEAAQIELEQHVAPLPELPSSFEIYQERRHKEQLERARKYRKERYRKIRDARTDR